MEYMVNAKPYLPKTGEAATHSRGIVLIFNLFFVFA
jgi:hypothetical protein